MRSQGHAKGLWGILVVVLGLVIVLAAARTQANPDSDGWLGVVIQNIDEDLQESEGLTSTDGVFVVDVVDDSPAEKAGLDRGDVILLFDGKDARSVRRLTRMIDWAKPGDEVPLVILKDGKEKKTVNVVIGEDKDHDMAFFGPDDFHFEFPDVPRGPHAMNFSLGQLSGTHIGVSLYELSEQLAKHYGASDGGALINAVAEDSPAEKAGLLAGDVIVKMDGKSVEDVDEIREAIAKKDDGEEIAVTVLRDGGEKTINVEVEEYNTWSGIGDRHFRSESSAPHIWSFGPRWNEARESYRGAMDELRDARGEWREDLREQLEDLREELKQLKKDLREKGF